jgi:hypothetical protein
MRRKGRGKNKMLGCKIRKLDRMRRHNNKKEEQIMGSLLDKTHGDDTITPWTNKIIHS